MKKEIKNFLKEEEGGIDKEYIIKTASAIGSMAVVTTAAIEQVSAHSTYDIHIEKVDQSAGIKANTEYLGC